MNLIANKHLLFPFQEDAGADKDDGVLRITTKSAVVFVISASTFLLLLYFFMSASFVWVLIVLFCLGGVEVSIHFKLLVRVLIISFKMITISEHTRINY